MENIYIILIFLLYEFYECDKFDVENGIVCYDWDEATVQCNNGFELQGPSDFDCSSSEKDWEPSIPDNMCVLTDTTSGSTSKTQQSIASANPTSGSTEPSSKTNEKPSDDSDSVVAAAVSVSVLTVIVIAAVIAFLLWQRRRRLKSVPPKEIYPGTSITNRNYEDSHGLDRHVSLQNVGAKDSVDREYAEIALENLHPEETTGNVYQTIDSLQEDQVESKAGYGHLKKQTTQYVDKNYSHFPINQTNGTEMTDITYAHSENTINEQVSNNNQVDADTTYNRLETSPKTNQGKQIHEKGERGNDDAETEYNHAKAGLSELTSEDKADTYSHLNSSCQKPLKNQRNASQDSNMQNHENESHGIVREHGIKTYDSLNAEDGNTVPEYAECMQNEKGYGRQQQLEVGPDGYETAVGTSHNYFILEPENEASSNAASFHVIGDNSEEKTNNYDYGEMPYHPYFTLEKTET